MPNLRGMVALRYELIDAQGVLKMNDLTGYMFNLMQ